MTPRALILRLLGTAERREDNARDIRRLAAVVDPEELARELSRWGLLPLLGTRLIAAAPDEVPPRFGDHVAAALRHSRRRSTLLAGLTGQLLRRLDAHGVVAVALKGPLLAQRVHGDSGMRLSSDLDLLVPPESFHAAVDVLAGMGWSRPRNSDWHEGLPLFESSLRASETWRPPIDLHWRLGWYERDFSAEFIEKSRMVDGVLVPQPAHEIVALFLHYARDGFSGPRAAVDIASWWDRYGAELEPDALGRLVRRHPALRPVVLTAAALARDTLGVPAADALQDLRGLTPKARRDAVRFQSLAGAGGEPERRALGVMVDWAVTPPGGRTAFLRRNFAPPRAVIQGIYGLPSRARVRLGLRRAYYATAVSARFARAAPRAIRSTRVRS